MTLSLATAQFPISADIRRNFTYICRQMREANKRGADVIHFPEGSLSGYAGVDFTSFQNFNWSLLKECTQKVMELAADLQLWVILGSAHPLSPPHKPHNCLYIINSQGKLVDRYDKRFCAGDKSESVGDLAHYSPGNHFPLFSIKGICCGTLICHDYRYPELYRAYKQLGAQLIFHSYHAGHMLPPRLQAMRAEVGETLIPINPGATIPEITMPASMISYAANNWVWISCSNTSAPQSCFSAFMVRPDGILVGKLRRNQPGILLTEVDPDKPYYDSTQAWRERAMHGQLHSGTLVQDVRSVNRTTL